MDQVITASKQIDEESDSFWNINDVEQAPNNDNDNDNDDESKEADEYVLETTAHPYPSSPIDSTIDTTISIDMDHHKRILEIQLLPKRMQELHKQLSEYKQKLDIEKERSATIAQYWKTKTSEISTKNQDLAQRMEV